MRSKLFWSEVLKRSASQTLKSATRRTSASLEASLRTLTRVTETYVAADKLYRSSKAHSGECEDDALRNIMGLYREKIKYEYKGVFRTPGSIKSMEAVLFLSKILKFSMKVGGGGSASVEEDMPGNREKRMDEDGVAKKPDIESGKRGNIDMEKPSTNRPAGVTKRKQAEKCESGTQHVARIVEKMATVLETAVADERWAASFGLQLEI